MERKRVQIRGRNCVSTAERVCDAYADDNNEITLEFKKGKVLTRISLTELNKQLEPLKAAN